MDNQNVNSLLTGLASSLNSYMGTQIASNVKQKEEANKNALELEKGKALDLNKAQLDLEGKSALETYKLALEGKVDREAAAARHPKAAEMVGSFEAKNGRSPTVKEFKDMTDGLDKKDENSIRRSEQDEMRMNRFVNSHSNKLAQLKIPELVGTYNELASVFKTGQDVKGVGVMDSHIPNIFLGAEGKANRTNLQQIANTILQQRSGAAVSDQEYKRFLTEVSGGKMPDEATIRKHIGKIGKDLRNTISQQEAGIPSQALDIYKSHPGNITSDQVDLYDGNKPGVAANSEGKKSLDDIFGGK